MPPSTALALINKAPKKVQAHAELLLDCAECQPAITSVRSFSVMGTDVIWEVGVDHDLVVFDEDGHPKRHSHHVTLRISSTEG